MSFTLSLRAFAMDSDKDIAPTKISSGVILESKKISEEEQKEIKEETTDEKKEQIKNGIADSTIELQKSKNERMIKELDTMLIREIPDKEKRLIAYQRIKKTYELRKQLFIESDKINDSSMKRILIVSFSHLIDLLDKRIISLER